MLVDEPLSVHGREAIRIAYLPYRGAEWTITLYPGGRLGASGSIVLRWANPRGWDFGWFRLDFRRAGYELLKHRIDAELARGEPAHGLTVCPDGDAFIIERRTAGRTTWVRQRCGQDDMATRIADIAISAFPNQLCPWSSLASDVEACKTMEPDLRLGADPAR
jgi:hypothetical protein